MLRSVASQLADDAGAKVRLNIFSFMNHFLWLSTFVAFHPHQVVPTVTKNTNILVAAPDPSGKTKLGDAAEKGVEVCLSPSNVFSVENLKF